LTPRWSPPSRTAATGELEISVADTAGFAQSLAAFANFTPSKNGNLEKKLFGTLPAIIVRSETASDFAQILVSARYLIELKLTNLPNQRFETWLTPSTSIRSRTLARGQPRALANSAWSPR